MPGLSLDKYVNIYPNPSTGVFTVSMNLPGTENTPVKMIISDVLGREVAVLNNGVLNQNTFRVDLSNKQNGIYFLSIIANNQTITKRIELTR